MILEENGNRKKEEDKRFIGNPGEIKVSYTRHGETKLTKIGDDGYAVRERHFSVHSHPNAHTNPHDHIINRDNNYPDSGKHINYYGDVPEFKKYGAFHEGERDKEFFLCEAYKDDDGTFFKSADDLLDFEIQGTPLRKIITDVTVWCRNL